MDAGSLAVVERCRAADAAAWRELYEANYGMVERTARRLGTPAEEVEDVVHEVFMVVHRRLDDFRGGRLTTWLYRITANIVSDRHRRRRVRRAFESLKLWIGGQAQDTPDRAAEKAHATRRVEQILERMAPKKREVFALFELEGLPGEEIAERLGCPVGTVWTRLHHARAEFLKIGRRLGALETEG
ncbi:MAG: sigma-70 family RNA polymerase sigma factor [Deltaproteobacteria bacterium]|jgi:RNA polymerase sigma-70 factor (ECF subfamily)|nr:sigma-70 family RNA polymerase sigma factor [Deltaproteobacteria bacterium]